MLPSSQTGSFEDDDENMDSVSMTIIPPHVAAPPADQSEIEPREGHEETEAQNSTLTMFTALSNCSNLHPDLVDPNEPRDPDLEHSTLYHAGLIAQGSTNGDLPPPMPGSGGWITAENMDEYFDAEGSWIGDENGPGLGPGAGTVRERESVQDDDANGEENTEVEETKWRKTS
jgi:nucleotide-sensitive chloride channel 1A